MLDPATARLCVWRLPLEAAFRLFSKLGSLGGSIRERFSRTGRTRPALARPAFSRWLLENDRLRERWPCQWLNVLYFPFSETSPTTPLLCKGRSNSKKHPKKSKQNVPILMGIFSSCCCHRQQWQKIVLGVQGLAPDKAQENAERYLLCSLAYGEISQEISQKIP